MRPVTEGSRVTPLELFFDLVFVYALTRVTALMADDATGRGVFRGMLVLSLLWWCWCCYSWLGNTVRADEGVTRIAPRVGRSSRPRTGPSGTGSSSSSRWASRLCPSAWV
jgi:hypothetical protein